MTETVVCYCILIFVSGFDWRRILSTPENFLFSLEESVNYIPELTSVTTKQDTAQSLWSAVSLTLPLAENCDTR